MPQKKSTSLIYLMQQEGAIASEWSNLFYRVNSNGNRQNSIFYAKGL